VPPLEVPLNRDTEPLLPELDVPVLRVIAPDTPADPTLALDTNTAPDPELTLDPLSIAT